jgi:hypothetical protein
VPFSVLQEVNSIDLVLHIAQEALHVTLALRGDERSSTPMMVFRPVVVVVRIEYPSGFGTKCLGSIVLCATTVLQKTSYLVRQSPDHKNAASRIDR